MAETIREFNATLPDPRGASFAPRACGRLMDDGKRWEGWIEFVPANAGAALRTERETVQPSRDHLEYWATVKPRAILDPFRVYIQGDDVLRGELAALKPFHLRNILHAYELEVSGGVNVASASHAEPAELIVAGVRARVGG